MYVIVGLGNPGKKYERTRHNVGFFCLDKIAQRYRIKMVNESHKAIIGSGYIEWEKVLLVKPQTYMNLSGESVKEIIDYYKIDASGNLIVIYDDTALPIGSLRIRKKGSAGGHNGVKNIIERLSDNTFKRIKVGIGEKPKEYDLADYVLGHFDTEEWHTIEESSEKVIKAVEMLVKEEVDAAMNRFN